MELAPDAELIQMWRPGSAGLAVVATELRLREGLAFKVELDADGARLVGALAEGRSLAATVPLLAEQLGRPVDEVAAPRPNSCTNCSPSDFSRFLKAPLARSDLSSRSLGFKGCSMLDEFDRDVVVSRRRVLSGIAVLGAAGVIVPAGKPPKGTGNAPPDTEPTPSTTASSPTSASSLTSDSSPTSASPPTSESDDDKEHKEHKPDLVLHGQFARLITPDGGGPSTSSADIVDDNGNPIGSFWSAAVAGRRDDALPHVPTR